MWPLIEQLNTAVSARTGSYILCFSIFVPILTLWFFLHHDITEESKLQRTLICFGFVGFALMTAVVTALALMWLVYAIHTGGFLGLSGRHHGGLLFAPMTWVPILGFESWLYFYKQPKLLKESGYLALKSQLEELQRNGE